MIDTEFTDYCVPVHRWYNLSFLCLIKVEGLFNIRVVTKSFKTDYISITFRTGEIIKLRDILY